MPNKSSEFFFDLPTIASHDNPSTKMLKNLQNAHKSTLNITNSRRSTKVDKGILTNLDDETDELGTVEVLNLHESGSSSVLNLQK